MPKDFAPVPLSELKTLTNGEFYDDEFSKGRYSTDASIYQIQPLAVFIPKSKDDVIKAVNFCLNNNISILPRGGGTSQCGQTVNRSLVIDNSKYFNKIIDFDEKNKTCTVEPGIVLDELNKFLKSFGLWFPVDVSTSSRATIGGMAGNNSCGGRSLKYGMMRDNVLSIEAILNDGKEYCFGDIDIDELKNNSNLNVFNNNIFKLYEKVKKNKNVILNDFPKVLRRVAGYNVDALLPDAMSYRPNGKKGDGINLSHFIVGSEGTLGYFTKIKLKLSELPSKKVMGVCHFPSFYESMDAAQHIVKLNPVSVELIDDTMLKLANDIQIFKQTVKDIVVGNPASLLVVEFADKNQTKNLDKLNELEKMMQDLGFNWDSKAKTGGVVKILNDKDQSRLTEMRKSGLNIMMSMKSEGKPVSFVEDCAVNLENLAEYTDGLKKIFKKYNVHGTWYAHASVGCLHVRPVLNMKINEDVKKMRMIAEEACTLVKKFGGSFSGEHGDGIVRSEFIEKMFDKKINNIFRHAKDLFDPNRIFNPEKIIDAPKMDDRNLFRYSPAYSASDIKTVMDWSSWPGKSDGFQGAIEMCNNNGSCRKLENGVMCPSYRVTKDEKDSPRGRANTLRLALTGQFKNDALTSKEMYETMKLCVSCKACKKECPTSVDISKMKIEIERLRHEKYGLSLSQKLIAYLPKYSKYLSYFYPILNILQKLKILNFVNEAFFNISAKRDIPLTKMNYFKDNELASELNKNIKNPVIIFPDSFNRFHEPENIRAAIRVLKKLGFSPFLPKINNKHLCCGKTFLTNGLIDKTKNEYENILKTFVPYLKKGIPVVGLEPSCILSFRDELPSLLKSKEAQLLSENSFTFEELLIKKIHNFSFKPYNNKVLLHGHCHQKAFDVVNPIIEILKRVPKIQLENIETSCCGMAGSFGYNKETYEVSIKMAMAKLIPSILKYKNPTVIADGTSCRAQIKDQSKIKAVHIASFLEPLIIEKFN